MRFLSIVNCTLCPCASLHLVLLCDVALSAFTVDMSNANHSSASSSSPKDPKGPQDGGSLEFEAEMIDANIVSVELPQPGNV